MSTTRTTGPRRKWFLINSWWYYFWTFLKKRGYRRPTPKCRTSAHKTETTLASMKTTILDVDDENDGTSTKFILINSWCYYFGISF
jgi:hypothetical protein